MIDQDDDDFDDAATETQVEVKPKVKRGKAESHKLDDVPVNMAECYWCNRVLLKEKMKRDSKYGIGVYVCNKCG